MHENLHFLGEDLSIESFTRNLEFSESKIHKEFENLREILGNFVESFEFEKLKEKSDSESLKRKFESKNLKREKLIEELYKNLTKVHENSEIFHTTPKMTRKIKIFTKKLSKFQSLTLKKVENFLNSKNENFDLKSEFLNFSLPIDLNIRSGPKRKFVKTLQEMFETANSEIYKSKTFIKLLREQKISIPLACDVKC